MKIRRFNDNFRVVIEGADIDLEGHPLDLTGLTQEDLERVTIQHCLIVGGNPVVSVPPKAKTVPHECPQRTGESHAE